MNGRLPDDPEALRVILKPWMPDLPQDYGPALVSAECCGVHPDWTVQTLWLMKVPGAYGWIIRRLIAPDSGVYVEDVAGLRGYVVPRGQAMPARLEAMARHALDGEEWRPKGGAPTSGRTQQEIVSTVLRLTVDLNRVPLQSDVAGEPGYPEDARRVRSLWQTVERRSLPDGRVIGRATVPLPWEVVYGMAAFHARVLAAERPEPTPGPEDASFLALSPSRRTRVISMLEKAAGH